MTFLKKYIYVLILVVSSTCFTLIGISKHTESDTYEEITVTEGDSLWQLAIDLYGNERPGRWVQEMMVMNSLDSSVIKPGDRLKVPASTSSFNNMGNMELAGEGK